MLVEQAKRVYFREFPHAAQQLWGLLPEEKDLYSFSEKQADSSVLVFPSENRAGVATTADVNYDSDYFPCGTHGSYF